MCGFRPSLVGFGRCFPKVSRIRPNLTLDFDRVCPDVCQISANFGLDSGDIGRIRPSWGRPWAGFGARSSQIRSTSGGGGELGGDFGHIPQPCSTVSLGGELGCDFDQVRPSWTFFFFVFRFWIVHGRGCAAALPEQCGESLHSP